MHRAKALRASESTANQTQDGAQSLDGGAQVEANGKPIKQNGLHGNGTTAHRPASVKATKTMKTDNQSDAVAAGFRRWGYLQAELDPFGRLLPQPHPELEVDSPEAEAMRRIYCSKIGVEFMHMPYPERCEWVAERMESEPLPIDQRFVLERILASEVFERYMHTRYVGSKRFSLDGLAALIPLVDTILDRAAEQGVEIAMMAMAHRGRLTAMYSIFGAEVANIFAGFEDVDPRSVLGGGDVKYHKGANGTYRTRSGREIRLHLASNPSHLEAVNPVLMGRVRARQERLGDSEGKKVLAVLIHGDAAFAGQGIAAEALNYAALHGFNIGGTVHIIANNLIGFTAVPEELHSSRFASDIAKRLAIPIWHVNAESPNDVCRVGQMACDYRNEFSSDVVIDLIGYRRYGHNEVDDPTLTSPVVYEHIKDHPLLHQIYGQELGVTAPELDKLEQKLIAQFKAEQERARAMTKQPVFAKMPDYWGSYVGGPYTSALEVPTAVGQPQLLDIARRLASVPAGFTVHPKLQKLLEQRVEMAEGKRPVDYGMAEALAFGSLLREGVPVRLTGQDSRRGTFSHRHATLYDHKTGEAYFPLRNVDPKQARFDVYDSMLSEAAAVGFEYGFSRDYPEALVLWEAQFGDFVNGAQIIIDQFVSAGEDKWGLLSGLVFLLPHGYEGQGPEHSSARVERFLQLCAEDNMQVAWPSNAGQYFHLLRRQALRKWRKPLVVFTPKSMLRAAAASSPIANLAAGSFQLLIDDEADFVDAERVIFCSGKIVHELRAERKKSGGTDTAIITIEQLYPFPEKEIGQLLQRYANARHIIWVQEEPANMGALFFVRPRLEELAAGRSVTTVRRSASASPATGSAKAHAMEQEALLKLAFARYS